MNTKPLGRNVLKSMLAVALCAAAFAVRADLIAPKPGCSQGAYATYVSVKWSAVSGAAGYIVWRSANSDINAGSDIGTTTDTVYYDYAVKPGTKYYYWIFPVDSDGYYYYNLSRFATGYAKKPSVAAPTVSAGTYQSYIKVTWKPVSGATGYEIYYSTSTTRSDYLYWDSNFGWDGKVYYTFGTMPVAKKYYFWTAAYINGYRFLSKVSKAGWRKKVLTVYTPKVVLIPANESTGTSWWYCALSGDLIRPSKASLSVSVKGCASFTKYGALDDDGFCGDITGKKNGKAYITVKHSSLTVKSKAITVIKAGIASASAS